MAEAAAEKKSDMAKAVKAAIGENTDLVTQPAAPSVSCTASSDNKFAAKVTGYTMSPAPEEITGWRGATLTNEDGDTTVVYTNIENAEAEKISDLYRASSDPGDPLHYNCG